MVETEMTGISEGLLIRKQSTAEHPVERVFGIFGIDGSTDEFSKDIRGE